MSPTITAEDARAPQEGEFRILAATGVCGSGFLETTFERALALEPHAIACDAGSTDPGPAYLGGGRAAFPRAAVKRDLRLMLAGARRINVPLILGSAGTAGGKPHLAWLYDTLTEIAVEDEHTFTVALIEAEQDREDLVRRFEAGQIKPLNPAPPLNADIIRRSTRIVGMMGPEPILKAIESGADVVLAGRSSDTALFAALPLAQGIPPGVAWHAAKILECGAAATVSRKTPDCMFAWLRKDHFVIEAPNPDMRCTPQSIASHALYENADPFRLVEGSGTLELSEAQYEAVSDTAVRVTGSRFEPSSEFTVKLEGAEMVGYQSVLIGSIRDPLIIRQVDDWLERLKVKIHERVKDVLGQKVADEYSLVIRVYGKDGTMGPIEPVRTPAHELCLVFEATAPTQEAASAIGGMTRHQALHLPIPEWSGLITALACPYNYLERGAVYRFNLNHVAVVADPCEMFPVRLVRIDGATRKEIAA